MTQQRIQFNTRHLLIASTLVCVSLSILTPVARHYPEMFLYASAGSFIIGLYGVGVLGLATLMRFSISATANQADRELHFAKCRNLALIGALMVVLPVLVISLTYLFLQFVPEA